jgi:hypothetical protein
MNNGKRLTPRQRAKWPASNKGYRRPQDQVAININPGLAEWLVGTIVGQSSFSGDLEETVTTILRATKGDLSPDVLPHFNGWHRRGAGRLRTSLDDNNHPIAGGDSAGLATNSPQAGTDQAEQLRISAGFSGSPVCGKFGSFGEYYGNL